MVDLVKRLEQDVTTGTLPLDLAHSISRALRVIIGKHPVDWIPRIQSHAAQLHRCCPRLSNTGRAVHNAANSLDCGRIPRSTLTSVLRSGLTSTIQSILPRRVRKPDPEFQHNPPMTADSLLLAGQPIVPFSGSGLNCRRTQRSRHRHSHPWHDTGGGE